MPTEPTISHYLDDEERELVEAIEHPDYKIGESHLTDQLKADLQASARATIHESRVKVTIRIPESDLMRLKARAVREGIPYQTLINSILHGAVS
ncbi:MAG: CopG family antitoxin [Pseudomonadota bacterium]